VHFGKADAAAVALARLRRRGRAGRLVSGNSCSPPLAVALIGHVGWQDTLVIFAGRRPCYHAAVACGWQRHGRAAAPAAPSHREQQSVAQAAHRGGSATRVTCCSCSASSPAGFQIFFIAVHLPAYLVDRGLPSEVGGWTLASIGLFNIVGAITAGWLAAFMPKRYILSLIYFGPRGGDPGLHPAAAEHGSRPLVFGAVMGLLWLSTVPPTSGLVAVMFGTPLARHAVRLCLLQPSGRRFSLGVWLGGMLFEAHRILRRGLVALDPARPASRRRSICRSSSGRWARTGAQRRLEVSVVRNPPSIVRIAMATFKAIVIEKDRKPAQRPALADFDERNLMDGDVTVPPRVVDAQLQGRSCDHPARRRWCAAFP